MKIELEVVTDRDGSTRHLVRRDGRIADCAADEALGLIADAVYGDPARPRHRGYWKADPDAGAVQTIQGAAEEGFKIAFVEGFDAGIGGRGSAMIPYDAGSNRAGGWNAGWSRGQQVLARVAGLLLCPPD